MEIIFEKEDLKDFELGELRKMMQIQIETERFEGAALIRDIIEGRKKDFGIINNSDSDIELQ